MAAYSSTTRKADMYVQNSKCRFWKSSWYNENDVTKKVKVNEKQDGLGEDRMALELSGKCYQINVWTSE